MEGEGGRVGGWEGEGRRVKVGGWEGGRVGGWEGHAQQQYDDGHHKPSTGKVVQCLSCCTRSLADEIRHN